MSDEDWKDEKEIKDVRERGGAVYKRKREAMGMWMNVKMRGTLVYIEEGGHEKRIKRETERGVRYTKLQRTDS